MSQETNPFQLKSTREVYKNPWIRVREDSVIRPDGNDGIFGIIEMQPGATVVALTPDKEILLAREYKYAVQRYTLECISGGANEGELILDAAKRELLEETGAQSENWTDLGVLDPFTSIILGPNHMFLAQEIKFLGEQNTDGGEIIELVRIPFNEAVNKVRAGEITHGASVAAILKTQLLLDS